MRISKLNLVLSTLLLVLLWPSITYPEANSPNKVFLDLDAPAGRFTTWKSTVNNSNEVSGEFKIVELKDHDKWNPTFTITLEDKGKENEFWVRIANYENGVFNIFVEYRKNKKPINTYIFPQVIKVGADVPFNLDWIDNKQIGISFHNEEKIEAELNFKVEKIGIASSTGELLVNNLSLE